MRVCLREPSLSCALNVRPRHLELLLDLEQLRSHLTAVQDAADQYHSDDADHHNQSDRDDLRGLLLDIPASSAPNTTTLHTEAVSQSGALRRC